MNIMQHIFFANRLHWVRLRKYFEPSGHLWPFMAIWPRTGLDCVLDPGVRPEDPAALLKVHAAKNCHFRLLRPTFPNSPHNHPKSSKIRLYPRIAVALSLSGQIALPTALLVAPGAAVACSVFLVGMWQAQSGLMFLAVFCHKFATFWFV